MTIKREKLVYKYLRIRSLESEVKRLKSFPDEYGKLEYNNHSGFSIEGVPLKENDVITIKDNLETKDCIIRREKIGETWIGYIENHDGLKGTEMALFSGVINLGEIK